MPKIGVVPPVAVPPTLPPIDSDCRILQGDCIEALAALPPDSVDAVVTDPPYGLEFMGKDFDSLVPKWGKIDDVPQEWIEDYRRENNSR